VVALERAVERVRTRRIGRRFRASAATITGIAAETAPCAVPGIDADLPPDLADRLVVERAHPGCP
jgi:hypothetical protein